MLLKSEVVNNWCSGFMCRTWIAAWTRTWLCAEKNRRWVRWRLSTADVRLSLSTFCLHHV